MFAASAVARAPPQGLEPSVKFCVLLEAKNGVEGEPSRGEPLIPPLLDPHHKAGHSAGVEALNVGIDLDPRLAPVRPCIGADPRVPLLAGYALSWASSALRSCGGDGSSDGDRLVFASSFRNSCNRCTNASRA